jgi:hypothetical protein
MKKMLKLGMIDVPTDYFSYDITQKKELCEDLIDRLYLFIDDKLEPQINRIEFLKDVLQSSLESNVQLEYYEVAAVINDCIKLLNED